VDKNGAVYVADTWNKRIQVFTPDAAGTTFTFARSWDVTAWGNQSTENKPFLAVDDSGNVFVTDPVGFRVLEFTSDGQIVRVWGQYSSGIDGFGNPVGITLDNQGHVWVMDSANSHALRFTLAAQSTVPADEVPAIPTANVTLSYDSASNQLVNPAKTAYYVLDTTKKIWVPIVPESVATAFAQQLLPSQDITGTWFLRTKDGTAVYQWDALSLTWQLLAPISSTPTK
jgi:hypothetical protein